MFVRVTETRCSLSTVTYVSNRYLTVYFRSNYSCSVVMAVWYSTSKCVPV